MGVALYVSGYKKSSDYIVGEIKMLGCYEVRCMNLSQIRIEGTNLVLHNVLQTAVIASQRYWDYGFRSLGELSFYHNMENSEAGFNFREDDGHSYELMYNPNVVLPAVKKLLQAFELFDRKLSQEDKQELLDLERVATLIAQSDGLISMGIG